MTSQEDVEPSTFPPTYSEALAALGREMMGTLVVLTSVTQPPHPEMALSAVTQVNLLMALTSVRAIGRIPGQLPIDQTIPFRKLYPQVIDWLEKKANIPVRQSFAPLAGDYTLLFEGGKRLPAFQNAQPFFNYLIHFFVVEAQILVAIQYFEGIGFTKQTFSPSWWSQFLIDEEVSELRLSQLNQLSLTELYGRVFLEYCILMLRAQWDKITRACCLALAVDHDWDSIGTALSSLNAMNNLLPASKRCLDIFIDIAHERLTQPSSWLKPMRDNLVHYVAKHSAGTVPHVKSTETTADLWRRFRDEHNWLREAALAAIAALLIAGWTPTDKLES